MSAMQYLFSTEGYWIWTIVESIAVTVTFILVVLQLKEAKNSNLFDVISSLENKWTSSEMRHAREMVCNNYINSIVTIGREEELVMGYFEDLGLLYRHNAINIDVIWNKHSYDMGFYWPMVYESIKTLRKKHSNDKSFYSGFELIYNKCNLISKKRKCPYEFTNLEIKQFAEDEMNDLA